MCAERCEDFVLCADGQSLSSPDDDARGKPGCDDEVAAGDLHGAIQCAAQAAGPSLSRAV